MPSAGRVLGLACALVGLAIDGLGCLSDDTAVTVRAPDAGALDGSAGIVDGGGTGDGANSLRDAGAEASPADGGANADAASSDAGRDSHPSQVGLVSGGTVAHSPNYKMTITSGPAAAPVLRSPNYQLVGGMAVSGN